MASRRTADSGSTRSGTVARIVAFSDGVTAIIITIMVLDLKGPVLEGTLQSDFDFSFLYSLAPKFLAYLISFAFIATAWFNHVSLMRGSRSLVAFRLQLHELDPLSLVRTFASEERRSRCLSRHRTGRYRPMSRCPETARGVRRHGRCAGQPLRSPPHTRRGRHGRPTAPDNRRRNIHWASKVGRGLWRGRTGCSHNGPGWSAPPRSSFRRTERQLRTM